MVRGCPECGALLDGRALDGRACSDCAAGRVSCHACGWDPGDPCTCPACASAPEGLGGPCYRQGGRS